MLEIRREQHAELEKLALRRFVDDMREHLFGFAPGHCEVVGAQGIEAVIGSGIKKARSYGVTQRGPVRLYLEMMVLFGSDFDSDPQYPWALASLQDPAAFDQMDRAVRLHERVMDYIERVVGPDAQHERAALRTLLSRYPAAGSLPGGQREDMLARLPGEIYPQKGRYLGEAALRELAAEALASTQAHRLAGERGPAVLLALMFALGHGCVEDPQFPWIAKTLGDTDSGGLGLRVDRLYGRFMAYVGAGLEPSHRV